MLASIFNSYTSTVRLSGVRLTSFPFPTGGGQFIRRRHINVCYARKIIVTTKYGAEAYHYFAMGVQTHSGHQADIHSRYNTANDALAAAREVCMILNSDPNANPIPVELVKTTHSNPAIWRQLLLWGTLTLIAVILGVVWDRA